MILEKIHSGHQGIVRTKSLARQTVYWRNINSDIENVVQSCTKCFNTRKFPDKVVLKSHPVPTRPFEKLGVDILTINGVKYQVIVCYFCKWTDVYKFNNNPTPSLVIKHIKSVIFRFGLPDIAFSDRESIYKSQEIMEFCESLDIKKEFSSAMYSQSNGQVEHTIGHIKNFINRCQGDLNQLQMCLLDYHNTPLDSNIGSPFQILMCRSVKGRLLMSVRNFSY